jgi:hypothetical protein
LLGLGPVFFVFLTFFSKDSLKYTPCGKISKNGPFAWRHSRWRQAITAWRHHLWRQDTADVANMAFDMAVLGAVDLGAKAWRQ